MALKENLLAVCNCEKSIYEKEERIKQTNVEIKRVQTQAATERQRLNQLIQEKKKKHEETSQERTKNLNYSPKGLTVPITTTAIVIAVTVIFHLLLNHFIVNVAGAVNGEDAILTLVLMNILPALLICEIVFIFTDLEWVGILVTGIISDAILTILGVIYFNNRLAEGRTFTWAIFAAMAVFIVIEVIIGLIACYNTDKSQEYAYHQSRSNAQKLKKECELIYNDILGIEKQLADYNAKVNVAINSMTRDRIILEKEIAQLKIKRSELYTRSTIHPKYQNWVAAATFYEYIDIGRCYELKGPDGAYNLYERELIANKIVGSLSAIQSNTGAIYSSQSFLRKEVSSIRRTVEQIPIKTYGM